VLGSCCRPVKWHILGNRKFASSFVLTLGRQFLRLMKCLKTSWAHKSAQAFEWNSWFKNGQTSAEDFEHSDCPSSSWTDENEEKVLQIVHEDRQCTIRNVYNIAGLSGGTCWYILMKDLKHEADCCKICAPYAEWRPETKLTSHMQEPPWYAQKRTETSLLSLLGHHPVPRDEHLLKRMTAEGYRRESSWVTHGAAEHHTMGVPEIFPAVWEALCPVYKLWGRPPWRAQHSHVTKVLIYCPRSANFCCTSYCLCTMI
jgi:hypothetical protein